MASMEIKKTNRFTVEGGDLLHILTHLATMSFPMDVISKIGNKRLEESKEYAFQLNRIISEIMDIDSGLYTCKRCRKCQHTYPATVKTFGKDPATIDGLKHECRSCKAAYMKKYRDSKSKVLGVHVCDADKAEIARLFTLKKLEDEEKASAEASTGASAPDNHEEHVAVAVGTQLQFAAMKELVNG